MVIQYHYEELFILIPILVNLILMLLVVRSIVDSQVISNGWKVFWAAIVLIIPFVGSLSWLFTNHRLRRK